MTIQVTGPAKKDFKKLDSTLQKKVLKQFAFLKEDLRHPSLNAKKFPERGEDVWQGRVDRAYRFYFTVTADRYVILRILPHPK